MTDLSSNLAKRRIEYIEQDYQSVIACAKHDLFELGTYFSLSSHLDKDQLGDFSVISMEVEYTESAESSTKLKVIPKIPLTTLSLAQNKWFRACKVQSLPAQPPVILIRMNKVVCVFSSNGIQTQAVTKPVVMFVSHKCLREVVTVLSLCHEPGKRFWSLLSMAIQIDLSSREAFTTAKMPRHTQKPIQQSLASKLKFPDRVMNSTSMIKRQ